MIVTLQDARALRYCSRGIRQFFARHGLDYSDFLRNGIPARDLRATGDAMALKVIEVAHGRRR